MSRDRVFPTNPYAEFLSSEVEQSIPARLEKQVEQHRDHLALQTPRYRLSYAALNSLANRLARAILAKAESKSVAVAILLDHDAPLIVAILAVLKAGRFYVVLDPSTPSERLRVILDDAGTNLLISDTEHLSQAQQLLSGRCEILSCDLLEEDISAENLNLTISPSALAYLIYTSGSTGKPKGVRQTHRNVLHHTRKYTNSCHLSANDRLSLLASCSFGASVSNTFGALLNGGTLLPFKLREEGIAALRDWLEREKITIYHSVPLVFRRLAEAVDEKAGFPHLRLIKLGGEAITRRDFELYQRSFAEHALLYVGLGSTEMNCIRYWLLDRQTEFNGSIVPVGYEVEDTDVLLLDEKQREVVAGEVGEIAIRSEYLFRGYWCQPELNKAAFIADPLGSSTPVFLTHDQGRMLPGGLLQHLGRNEFQIKIRGAHVETAEVEMALRKQAEISDCAVIARNRGDEKELIAYLTNGRESKLDNSALRSRLATNLPDYMIPADFIWLEQLPRINGKVDRQLLAQLDLANSGSITNYVAPRNGLETDLVRIWQDVLQRERVGVRDNFFELGGHSLSATRVALAIEQLVGIRLPPSTLFWAPTIEALARYLMPERSVTAAKSLVELQPEGSELPLFIIHGWGGDVHFYGELAKLLPEQPVYGLQAVGIDGKALRHTSVEDMAAHYLNEIQTVQPHGPYHLIGYSLGTLIAFEVAQQAYRRGERVDFLGLLDPPSRPAPWLTYARTIAPLLVWSGHYHLTRWVRSGGRESFHFKRRLKRLRGWINRNRRRIPAVLASPECSSTRPTIDGFKDYYSAVAYPYRLRPYPGAIDLVIGDNAVAALLPLWGYLAKGGASHHRVGCTHKEMIQRDFLPTLATTLRTALAKARVAAASRRSKPIASA